MSSSSRKTKAAPEAGSERPVDARSTSTTPNATPRKVTLGHIAKVMNLSVSTISMALSDDREISLETRRKVRETAHRLHYNPRRRRGVRFEPGGGHAAGIRPGRLALVTIGYADEMHYVQELLRAVVTTGQNRNCRVELAGVPRGPIVEQIARIRAVAGSRDGGAGVDGLILEGFLTRELIESLLEESIPFVALGHIQGDPLINPLGGYQVIADVHGMAYRATHTLIARGSKRPGLILVDVIQNLWGYHWLSGYRHALADAGIAFDPRLFKLSANAAAPGRPNDADSVEIAQHADGIIIANTNIWRSYTQWAQANGFTLPLDRMVMGGSKGAVIAMGLLNVTTVVLDHAKMSLAGMELLLAGLERRITPPVVFTVPFDFYPDGMTLES